MMKSKVTKNENLMTETLFKRYFQIIMYSAHYTKNINTNAMHLKINALTS